MYFYCVHCYLQAEALVRIAELEEYAADRDERVQRLESRVGRLVTVTLHAFMYSDNIHKL